MANWRASGQAECGAVATSSAFQLERHRRERRKADHERVGPGLPREIFGFEAAHVSDVSAAVSLRIGVNDLAIKAGDGNAEPIAVADDRRRVDDEDDDAATTGTAHESDHAVLRIMEIDPLESFVGIVAIPERGLVFVNVVEMLNEPAETVVLRQSRKLPVELAVVVPFAALAEFAAHEKQLLAGMPIHPGEEHSQIRELL